MRDTEHLPQRDVCQRAPLLDCPSVVGQASFVHLHVQSEYPILNRKAQAKGYVHLTFLASDGEPPETHLA